jgi:DNA (cytosine-5)-methyltransferase 3A
VKYFAAEIDKYAMKVSHSNFPDIQQIGDAFQVREDNWVLGG